MFFKYTDENSIDKLKDYVGKRPNHPLFVGNSNVSTEEKDFSTGEKDIYYVYDCHNYTNISGKGNTYSLALYVNKPDGSKLNILVNGIEISIFINYSEENLTFVKSFLNKEYCKYDVVDAKPFKGFNEHPLKYIKIYFKDLETRDIFVKDFKKSGATFTDISVNNSSPAKIVYNCTSALKFPNQVAARYKNIKLTGWIKIDPTFMEKCDNNNFIFPTFIVNVSNIEEVVQKKRHIPLYMMSWDIETKTFENNGTVPEPKSCFSEVKQLSMCFSWYGLSTNAEDNKNFKTISLSTFISDTDNSDNYTAITCASQYHLLIAFATIIKEMRPDVILDFNGFKYDWPFVIEKAKKYFMPKGTVLDYLRSCVSSFDINYSGRININSSEIHPRAVKLSPEFTEKYYFMRYPGCIPLDMRVVAARASDTYMPFESQNLNFYLQKNKLPLKLDMHFMEMDAIFTLHMCTLKYTLTYNHTSIIPIQEINMELMDLIEVIESGKLNFDFLKGKELVHKLTEKTTEELIQMMKKTNHIIKYCNYDAKSCILLCNKLKTISSYESLAILSCVPMENVAYNAGSGKVSNMVFAECLKENYLIDEDFKPDVGNNKYDGAYFPRPKVGFNNTFPTGDLDVVSEYPNVCSAYNLSPEKCVFNILDAHDLEKKGYNVLETKYKYGDPDSIEERPTFTTWFVQFDKTKENFGKGMSVFTTILRRLFDTRKRMVRLMNIIKLEIIPELNKYKVEDHKKIFENLITNDKYKTFIVEFNEVNTDSSIIDELEWMISDLDVKQYNRKIMMNTFYGTSGSKYNHLFLVQVSASITAKARDTTKTIESIALKHGFEVVYGDTDSIYVIPSIEVFKETLKNYEDKLITKQQHWNNMITITVKELKKLEKLVNEELARVSQTNFIEVTFERVLFPMLICGLKYYLGGIYDDKDKTSLDLSLAETDEQFNKIGFEQGRLHKKGQLITKNTNGYTKSFVISFLRRIFHINGSSNLLDTLKEVISEMKFEYKLVNDEDTQPFIKRAKYKENKSANHHITQFINNMYDIKKLIPSLTIPTIGEQFRFLMVKLPKDPLIAKSKIKKAHNYVMINNIHNKELLEYYGIDRFELDIKSYFESLISSAAKLLFIHDEFFDNTILEISFSDNRKKYSDVMKKNVKKTAKKLIEDFKHYLPKIMSKKEVACIIIPKIMRIYNSDKINTLTYDILIVGCSQSLTFMWRKVVKYVEMFLKEYNSRGIRSKSLELAQKLDINTLNAFIDKAKALVKHALSKLWQDLGHYRTNPDIDIVLNENNVKYFLERVSILYQTCLYRYLHSKCSATCLKSILSDLR